MPALVACTLLMHLTQTAIHSQMRVPQMRLLMRVCGQKHLLGELASTLTPVPGARISKSADRVAPVKRQGTAVSEVRADVAIMCGKE